MLIAQLSDLHVKRPGTRLYGRVDTAAMAARALAEVARLDPPPDLVALTGDLADGGLAEEYAHLRRLLAPLRTPWVAIPGNHDDREAFRAAFGDQPWMPSEGFVQYAIDDRFALRIVALDTVLPGEDRGELCDARLAWLETTLARAPGRPTVVLMHHPPFVTQLARMDAYGLDGRERFAAIVARHPQVELIACGHVHRHVHALVGGRAAVIAPSTAHQLALDLRPDAPLRFRLEPPGWLLHAWGREGRVTHVARSGDFGEPHPFREPDEADDG
jgi:3',5'-cyclic AMP phosphodiesterase CpdA